MLGDLIAQVATSVPISDLVNQWTTTIVGIMTAIGGLGAAILALAQLHNHSPKLATAAADIEHLKTFATEIKQAQPQLVQGAAVVAQVVPGLQDAANQHEKDIALVKQQLDALTAKLNLLTTIVPGASVAPAAPTSTNTPPSQ